MLTLTLLTQYLHDALDHLYEPDNVALSPLPGLLGIRPDAGASLALRHVLIDGIKALRPDRDCAPESPRWRSYEVLSQRYIQQLTQREVAEQIGLSTRHVRREQEVAIEALAVLLWEQFHLGMEASRWPGGTDSPPPELGDIHPSLDTELAWLGAESQGQTAEVAPILSAVLHLITPLAERLQVHINTSLPETLPHLAVHPMALRQMLVSLLSAALYSAAGADLTLSVSSSDHDAVFNVCVSGDTPPSTRPPGENNADVQVLGHLAKVSGGTLSQDGARAPFPTQLTLPMAGRVPILLIDDCEDNLRLLTRYATGTRYRIVGTQHPQQTFDLIKAASPCIIVLDIMMPEVDGWELLQRLLRDPLSSEIPIILCTILSQKDLALTLGAKDLLTKPVSRTAFLGALDRLWASREPISG